MPVRVFKDTIDTIVGHQVNECQSRGVSWPGSDRLVTHGPLTYSRFTAAGPKPFTVAAGEDGGWVAAARGQRVARYGGSIALIAIEGNDETLVREWTLDSPLGGLPITTAHEITDASQLAMATEWVRSPYVYPDALEALGVLQPDEMPGLEARFAEAGVAATELRRDLEALARQRRNPPPYIILT